MMKSQDKVSYGIGTQDDRDHGIFEASGAAAHVLAHWFFRTQQLNRDDIYCTRIDLQITRKRPDELDYIKTHKRLRPPKQLILGDEGNTLYIGNRQSDSFWRLYDKTEQDVRLEVELKGKQAKRAWTAFMQNASILDLFQTYVKKSRVPKYLAEHYMIGEDILDMTQFELDATEDLGKKLAWLIKLDALVYKLAHDHDTKDQMGKIIKRWYKYTTNA
jgi:hypothetical protein